MNTHNKNQDYLLNWYNQYPGQLVLHCEAQLLNDVLPRLFGYYLLQLSPLASYYTLKNNCILNVLQLNQQVKPLVGGDVISHYGQMPYANSSIDTVFLPHIIEYEDNTQQLLNEALRVLIPDGYLIITGFNPCSLLGLWNKFRHWLQKPTLGHCHTLSHICKPLMQQGVEVIAIKTGFYRPILNNKRWMERFKFLEVLGRISLPRMGGVYVIVAQKKLIPLSPIKLNWHARLNVLGKEIVSFFTRSCHRDQTR